MSNTLPESNTAVVERNRMWEGRFETEPWETAWAHEAVFFIRALEACGSIGDTKARVQISPDGMHWCDEGTLIDLPDKSGAVSFGRVSHFAGWLRIVGELPESVQLKVIVYLSLKA